MQGRRGNIVIVFGALATLVASPGTYAADLREISVELADDRYRLVSETYFDVPREDLYEVLTNFDLFAKFSSAIVESSNKPADGDGRPGFYQRMEGCVLLFCKSFIRNGYVLTTPEVEIIAVSDPELSDFEYSRERWQLIPEGEGTLLIYDFEMDPRFWIPPVVGPYFLKRALKDGGARAVDRIEALAMQVRTAEVQQEDR